MIDHHRITLVTGHFGSGKTELALNLAINEKQHYPKVAINDLDVINPYFRSRDAHAELIKHQVELLAPKGQLSTSDLPIVSGEMYRVIHDPSYRLIVDAGGDQDGAMALGQYFNEWKELKPEVLFVLNANRPYVSTLEGVLDTIEKIEKASRLAVTGIINNTNIASETTINDIIVGYDLSQKVARCLQIPMLCTTISTELKQETKLFAEQNDVLYINRYMKVPWES